ncbi:hypothetical protein SAMN02910398_03336 [Butyrivibrio sp. YAB3001]|nr:hypothetical protein SAMN02910398_03336 [Butyrivibrio sp. YAB3001]
MRASPITIKTTKEGMVKGITSDIIYKNGFLTLITGHFEPDFQGE